MGTAAELAILLSGSDRSGPAFQSATRHMQGLDKAVRHSTSGLADMAKTAVGVVAGLGAFAGISAGFDFAKNAVIGLNSTLEQNRIAFTTMLGSSDAANAHLAELSRFAQSTPFEFKSLAEASKRMQAFGFSADEVLPLLTAVGDSVSAMGMGQAGIDRATLALGQMQAKGKVTAEEMMQLTELGIPAWQMLADTLGTDVASAMEAVEKRTVSADAMVTAFKDGSASRFGGMMEAQSKTFAGAMSTITDSLSMGIAQGFQPFFEMASKGAVKLSEFLTSESFTTFAAGAAETMANLAASVSAGIEAIWPTIERLGAIIGKVFGGDLKGALAGVQGLIGDVGPGIVDQLSTWGQAFLDWIAPMIPPLLAELGQIAQSILAWAGEQIPVIVETLATWGAAFLEWIGPMIPPFLAQLGQLANGLFQWVVAQIPGIVEQLGAWAQSFLAWVEPAIRALLPELGKLAEGVLNWIMESGPPLLEKLLAEWLPAFLVWVAETIVQLIPKLAELLFEIGKWIVTVGVPKILELSYKLGEAVLTGWVQGLSKLGERLAAELIKGATAALNEAKRFLGIESPSRVFAREVGEPMIDGIIKGIVDRAPTLKRALEDVAKMSIGATLPMVVLSREQGMAVGTAIGSALQSPPEAVGSVMGALRDKATVLSAGPDAAIAHRFAGMRDQALALQAGYARAVGATATDAGAILRDQLQALQAGYARAVSTVDGGVAAIGERIADGLLDAGPATIGEHLADSIGEAIDQAEADIPEQLSEYVAKTGEWIRGQGVPQFAEFATDLGRALIDGTIRGLAGLAERLGNAFSAALEQMEVHAGFLHFSARGGFWTDAPALSMAALALPSGPALVAAPALTLPSRGNVGQNVAGGAFDRAQAEAVRPKIDIHIGQVNNDIDLEVLAYRVAQYMRD